MSLRHMGRIEYKLYDWEDLGQYHRAGSVLFKTVSLHEYLIIDLELITVKYCSSCPSQRRHSRSHIAHRWLECRYGIHFRRPAKHGSNWLLHLKCDFCIRKLVRKLYWEPGFSPDWNQGRPVQTWFLWHYFFSNFSNQRLCWSSFFLFISVSLTDFLPSAFPPHSRGN